VGIKLTVSHNETEIFKSKYEQLTWFENVPNHNNTRVTNNSATAGYQSPPFSFPLSPSPFSITEHQTNNREHSIPRNALNGNESFESDPKFHLSLEIRVLFSYFSIYILICVFFRSSLMLGQTGFVNRFHLMNKKLCFRLQRC